MNKKQLPEGVEVRSNSVRVYFNYEGLKCREPLRQLKNNDEDIAYAGRLVQQIKHEIRAGTFDYARHFPESTRLQANTLGAYLDIWLQIKRSQVADSTYRSWTSYVEIHIRPRWGSKQADTIDRIDLEQWIADLAEKKNLSNKTIREIIAVMRQVYTLYRGRVRSAIDPTEGISIRTPDPDDPDPFTKAELDIIFATPTERLQEMNLVRFMAWSGPRVSEAIALAWEDVDLEAGTVTFRRAKVYHGSYKVTKTRRSTRKVELLAPALEALRAQFEHTGHMQPVEIEVKQRDNRTTRKEQVRFVFHRTTTGEPFQDDKKLRDLWWRDHVEGAGVRYRGPGQLRHTFASQLLTAGMPAEWVASQLGHTTTEMLRRNYGKWIPDDAPINMAQFANQALGFDGASVK